MVLFQLQIIAWLFWNRYCAIRGPVAFAGEALLQDSLQTQGLLNQKNFTDVITDAVSLSTKDVIHTDKRFLQGVSIAQDVTVNGNVYVSGLANGVHLTSLKDDILLNDGKQEVTGKKVFTQEVKCLSGLHKVGSINGISLEDGIVVQGRKQNIYGKLFIAKKNFNIIFYPEFMPCLLCPLLCGIGGSCSLA